MSEPLTGKLRIAVVFGGRSVEHEVSIISALQAVQNMNPEKYVITPVYMTKDSSLFVGEKVGEIESYRDIDALLKESQRVIIVKEDGEFFLTPFRASW